MAEVKALFPIGKTQWSKWNDNQKTAFNEARAAGVPFADAVAASNQMKRGGILGVLKDVAEAVETVTDVVAVASPAVAVAKTVVRATRKKKA
jgi:sensor domain CHASE-containing protein